VTRTVLRTRLLRIGGAAAAVALTVSLGQSPAAGSFSGRTLTGGSTVGAASSFCVGAGAQDVPVLNDTFTVEDAATTPHATTPYLQVHSGVGTNRQTYLRFPLPTAPKHCELLGAQLRVRNASPSAGRVIAVHRADPAENPQWTPAGLTWSNQPAFVGTAVTSSAPAAPGVQTWDVTAHTAVLMGGPNNGFVLKDATEGQNGQTLQQYDEQSTAGGTPAVLRLTWG